MASKAYGSVHVRVVEAFYDLRWGMVIILRAYMGAVELGYNVYTAECSEQEAREFLPSLIEHFGDSPVQASLS